MTRRSAFAIDSCERCVVVVGGTCITRSIRFARSFITVVNALQEHASVGQEISVVAIQAAVTSQMIDMRS